MVPWDQVENYKHLDCGADAEELAQDTENWYEIPEQETSTESFTGMPQAVRTGQAAEKGEKARRAFPTAEAMREAGASGDF